MFPVNLNFIILFDLTKGLTAVPHLSCFSASRNSHKQLIIINNLYHHSASKLHYSITVHTENKAAVPLIGGGREADTQPDSFTVSGNSLWSKNNIKLASQDHQMTSP